MGRWAGADPVEETLPVPGSVVPSESPAWWTGRLFLTRRSCQSPQEMTQVWMAGPCGDAISVAGGWECPSGPGSSCSLSTGHALTHREGRPPRQMTQQSISTSPPASQGGENFRTLCTVSAAGRPRLGTEARADRPASAGSAGRAGGSESQTVSLCG